MKEYTPENQALTVDEFGRKFEAAQKWAVKRLIKALNKQYGKPPTIKPAI